MKRKYFQAMAEYISDRHAHVSKVTYGELMRMAIELGVKFNPRFDVNRFVEACKPKSK